MSFSIEKLDSSRLTWFTFVKLRSNFEVLTF